MNHETRHVEICVLDSESVKSVAHSLEREICNRFGDCMFNEADKHLFKSNARVTITVQELDSE